jgi:hypothetical protein
LFHCDFGWQIDEFVLAIDGVPIIDEPRFQHFWYFDFHFHFGLEKLLAFSTFCGLTI